MRDFQVILIIFVVHCTEWKCSSLAKCGRAVRVCFLQTCQRVQHHPPAIQHRRHQRNGHTGISWMDLHVNRQQIFSVFVVLNYDFNGCPSCFSALRLWPFMARWPRRARKRHHRRRRRRRAKSLETKQHHLNSRDSVNELKAEKRLSTRRGCLCFSYQGSEASVCEQSSRTSYWRDRGTDFLNFWDVLRQSPRKITSVVGGCLIFEGHLFTLSCCQIGKLPPAFSQMCSCP